MSLLKSLVDTITPPPVLTPEKYDGYELRWKFFVFRPASAYFAFTLNPDTEVALQR